MELAYHIPALLNETVEGLEILPDGVYADLTFGGGGHSRAILSHLSDNGKLYGFDQDIDAYANRIDDKRFTFVYSNFRYLSNFMRYYGEEQIDGIVADLGVSFHHFDDEKRGFSFRFEEGELDMRMNRNSSLTARDILNTYTEERLADIFFLFGEMKNSRRVASEIVKARASRPFATTDDFLKVVSKFIKPTQEKKELAQLFQALRIEVNNEIDVLKSMLSQSLKVLKPGGRIAVLTYHSLEDRIVKNYFKTGNISGKVEKDFFGRIDTPFRLVNNKVIVPSDEEIERNPRSRSAKLRIAEKL
ncbi:MAG: 16S rRNA (cytosine(1402)-N(4))-methyltransferase RsmH [Bacteroidales bacterium]|nr:16S rRNA (cytosine(1402)-N(4))-methyltransferase RsmH [Bacteroidales bacterium]MDY2931164.1 16S rRNA (cytosine(1402)-N(4))-methyltransferase RsmH [Muribaculaceae bacterium]MDD6131706.1 16S rRNA (cytosine(1402)-N(4))-methyltransferase RsmH [Bacteroidales bacterium]MDD6851306.1 16S rRNA (cytosine(1402)-N(4))-methyltransferase RsmH [Bacteroidales bacterium]MDD7405755.1 16S rRNA (cytosine(1402)-N(4))-methyltransferase RsmH [Bacteroidales bacterium]